MLVLNRKIIADDHGNPRKVLIPWSEFKKVERVLGMGGDEALHVFRETRGAKSLISMNGRIEKR